MLLHWAIRDNPNESFYQSDFNKVNFKINSPLATLSTNALDHFDYIIPLKSLTKLLNLIKRFHSIIFKSNHQVIFRAGKIPKNNQIKKKRYIKIIKKNLKKITKKYIAFDVIGYTIRVTVLFGQLSIVLCINYSYIQFKPYFQQYQSNDQIPSSTHRYSVIDQH